MKNVDVKESLSEDSQALLMGPLSFPWISYLLCLKRSMRRKVYFLTSQQSCRSVPENYEIPAMGDLLVLVENS